MVAGLLENDFMFSGRGMVPVTMLDGILASDEAIKAINQILVFSAHNWTQTIPGYVANVRSDSREVLGIISDQYRVAQNQEVFIFVDELTGTNHTRYL
jgi:hypothetical protein